MASGPCEASMTGRGRLWSALRFTRSTKLSAKVTPAALMACRSQGASRVEVSSTFSSKARRSPLCERTRRTTSRMSQQQCVAQVAARQPRCGRAACPRDHRQEECLVVSKAGSCRRLIVWSDSAFLQYEIAPEPFFATRNNRVRLRGTLIEIKALEGLDFPLVSF